MRPQPHDVNRRQLIFQHVGDHARAPVVKEVRIYDHASPLHNAIDDVAALALALVELPAFGQALRNSTPGTHSDACLDEFKRGHALALEHGDELVALALLCGHGGLTSQVGQAPSGARPWGRTRPSAFPRT